MGRVLSFVLDNIQYVGIIVATITGLIATVTTTRDSATNRLTVWGRASTALICVALAISFAAQWKTNADDRSKAQAEQQQTALLLRGIDQAVNPLVDLRLQYRFVLPSGDPAVEAYATRLAHLSMHLATSSQNHFPCLNIAPELHREAFFWGDSAWMPQSNSEERLAYVITHYAAVMVQFYRDPIDAPWKNPQADADLRLLVNWRPDSDTGCSPDENVGAYGRTVSYDPRAKTIEVAVNNDSVGANPVSPRATVVSLVDLPHTDLLIEFAPGTEYVPFGQLDAMRRLLPSLRLTAFTFVLGPRQFDVDLGRCAQEATASDGYAYVCPLMGSVYNS
jgi:hypothetical protein